MKNTILIAIICLGLGQLKAVLAGDIIVDGTDSKSYSIVSHYQVQINAHAKKVWPHLNNLKSWMIDFDLSTVSGEPGEIGEVLRLYPQQDFYIQRLFAVPEKILVFANLPTTFNNERGHGQTVISLEEKAGVTTVSLTFGQYFTWLGDGDNPMKKTRQSKDFQEKSKSLWEDRFLMMLKELSQ